MKLAFYKIPVDDAQAAQDELNRFLSSHRVTNIEKNFVNNGANSCWAVCIEYLDGATSQLPVRKGKVDYREVLNEKEFAVFAKLRNLRRTLAEQEGLPAYALFTNEQLAAMVQRRVTSKGDLSGIDGIGESRVGKYGEAFLAILSYAIPSLDDYPTKENSDEASQD
jgi:superfamily II DNA helicase RecQ